MKNIEIHRVQLEGDLRRLDEQIYRQQAFLDYASESEDAKLVRQMKLDDLRARRVYVQAMLSRLDEMEDTSLWDDVKEGLVNTWANVKTAVSNATERLGE